jgi:hypothetical protein
MVVNSSPDTALAALSDRLELETLVSGLGRWLDGGQDAARAHELLAEHVEVSTLGGTARGIDAVVAQAQRNHDVTTQHLISDRLVTLDGDRAEITANLLVVFADGAPVAVGPRAVELPTAGRVFGERYRLAATRTDAGWRLSRIEIKPLWVAGSRPS